MNVHFVGRYSTVQVPWKIIRTSSTRWSKCGLGKCAFIGGEAIASREIHVGSVMSVPKIRLDLTKQPLK